MRRIDKISRDNPAIITRIMDMLNAFSIQHIVAMCDNSEETSMFLEFLTTQEEHTVLSEYLGERCYCKFGSGQLECGRDDLPSPLWCVNWLKNRTQAYKCVKILRNMGIHGEIELTKGLDGEFICAFKEK